MTQVEVPLVKPTTIDFKDPSSQPTPKEKTKLDDISIGNGLLLFHIGSTPKVISNHQYVDFSINHEYTPSVSSDNSINFACPSKPSSPSYTL